MALGTFNNNKRTSGTELTVYSNLKFSNNQSEVDKTSLSFTFWNNLMGIQMAPIVTGADGNITYDRDNAITIYLSVTKAMMLADEIGRFLDGTAKNVGVHTRTGIINITDGSEYGASSPCITIRKLDENGQVISAYTYQIRAKYHYSIDNFEERKSSSPIYEKNYNYDDIEIKLIKIQCEEYVRSMAMANAYATGQVIARQNKRLDYKITKIGEASGISFENSNGGYSSNRQSFFDSDNNLANSNNDDFE